MLTITQCYIDGVYKAIVIDRNRPRWTDRIVYIAEDSNATGALREASEYVKKAIEANRVLKMFFLQNSCQRRLV